MTNKTGNTVYFPALDSLRSIACLFVLVSHTCWSLISENLDMDRIPFAEGVMKFWFGNGGFGVHIFFVLSGFLISYLLLKERLDKGSINLRNFYIRRVLRIWPVYFTVLVLAFVVFPAVGDLVNRNFVLHESPLLSVLFLSNYDLIDILATPGEFPNGVLSLTWSVSVEEQFYLIWPLIFIVIPLVGLRWTILSVMAASLLFIGFYADNHELVYHHLVSNIVFLGIGGLIAVLYSLQGNSLKAFVKNRGGILLSVLVIALFLMMTVKKQLFNLDFGILFYWLIEIIFLGVLFLLVVGDSAISGWLSRRLLLIRLSAYTYGLYMYHRVAILITEIGFDKIGIEREHSSSLFNSVTYVGTVFGISLLLSVISYKIMERPILMLKKRFSAYEKPTHE